MTSAEDVARVLQERTSSYVQRTVQRKLKRRGILKKNRNISDRFPTDWLSDCNIYVTRNSAELRAPIVQRIRNMTSSMPNSIVNHSFHRFHCVREIRAQHIEHVLCKPSNK